jgi:hypothetical protein
MEKCLDNRRFHDVEGDTDSLYFAISGEKNEDINQRFKHIFTDEKFYNENVYKWLPSDFYSSDNSNPTFETSIEKMDFDKTLLGYAIEKQSQHMIALASKMYTAFNDNSTVSLKLKAVSSKKTNLNNYHSLHVLEEKCTKVMLCNTHQTLLNHLKPNLINTIKVNNDVYQCEYARKTFGCNTPIQCGFFTLDNAKYWVLNFYYNFMEKCLDHTRFRYIEGDTDSLYFAITGEKSEGICQRFKNIFTDEKFYNENVYKWLPSDFYSSDNYNPTFNSPIEKMGFDKKLFGYTIEKQS